MLRSIDSTLQEKAEEAFFYVGTATHDLMCVVSVRDGNGGVVARRSSSVKLRAYIYTLPDMYELRVTRNVKRTM